MNTSQPMSIEPKSAEPLDAIQVAVGILTHHHQYLFTQRVRPPFADYWEFPGGKVEASETPLHALDRELFEEVGIRIDHAQTRALMQPFTYVYPHYTVCLHVFLVQAWQNDPYAKEGQNLLWAHLPIDQHAALTPLLPAAETILQALARWQAE